MTTYQNEYQNQNDRNLSDVEKLFIKLQGTFGGSAKWYELDLNAQQIFIQSVNNIRAICSL